MARIVNKPPKAKNLVESLRAVGYSFESAISDIVDNSISANASEINIFYPGIEGDTYLYILDNGFGMTSEELSDAMQFACKNFNDERKVNDLGRFGMGLKSASFSQCKKLIVASKKNNQISAFSWDLDEISKSNDWSLIEFDDQEINQIKGINKLKAQSTGTLVVWENFDIIEKSEKKNISSFLTKKLTKTKVHISLIFHRFMSGIGNKKINIFLNNDLIKPIDPFLEKHNKTEPKKESEIRIERTGEKIYIKPYILPYQNDLTEEDFKTIGGKDNMFKMQGIYIYRSNRLIIWGTWLGIKSRNELAKYARIKVDIPNSIDDICSIDIKKQNAKLPSNIEECIKTHVIESFDGSRRKNKHRGVIDNSDNSILWHESIQRDKTVFFQINRNHPFINKISSDLSDENIKIFDNLLKMIEKDVPYISMYNAVAEKSISEDSTEYSKEEDEEIKELLSKLKK